MFEAYALQSRTEIREAEMHKAHLQHLKREPDSGITQADVNDVQADIEYMRRELMALNIVMQAKANGIELPLVDEPEATRRVRARLESARLLIEERL